MMDIDEFLDKEIKAGKEKQSLQSSGIGSPKEDINNLLNIIREHISRKEFSSAEELYITIQEKLANVPIEDRLAFFEQLTKVNQTLLKSLNDLSIEVDGKISLINSMMQKGREQINKGDLDSALKTYSELRDVYSTLPDAFNEKKRLVHDDLLVFHKEIEDKLNNESLKKLNNTIKEITDLIAQAKYFLNQKQVDYAVSFYSKCTGLFNQLPPGFLRDKAKIYDEILKLYGEINVNVSIMGLQKRLQAFKISGAAPASGQQNIKTPTPSVPPSKGNAAAGKAGYAGKTAADKKK